jgi:hypothetical protein
VSAGDRTTGIIDQGNAGCKKNTILFSCFEFLQA